MNISGKVDYPKLLGTMLAYLYKNKLLSSEYDFNYLWKLWDTMQASSLYWEICAFAYKDIWEDDTPIVQAIWDSYNDWDK